MLTTEQIAAHLKRLTYKPGWTFEVYQGRWEGHHIVIRTEVPDTYKPGETCVLDVHSFLHPVETVEELERWLMHRIVRLEIHEAREFFKRDNRVLFNPHAPDAEHDRT